MKRRSIALLLCGVLAAVGLMACEPSPVTSIAARTQVNAIDPGQQTHVVGNINPRRAGQTVVLERRLGSSWSERGRQVTDGNGAFRISIRPSDTGIYAFRVRAGSVSSPTFYVRVWFRQFLDELRSIGSMTARKGEHYVDGKRYTRSIYNGSCSTTGGWEWDLGRRYGRFDSVIGLADDAHSSAARNYYVYKDGQLIKSGTVRLGRPQTFSLDVSNALRLRIQWTRAGSSCRYGDIVLGNPMLRR